MDDGIRFEAEIELEVTRHDRVRPLLDRTKYARRIRAERESRFGAGEASWYVPRRARLDGSPAQPLADIVDRWLAEPVGRPLALLGGYGSGKTSFCLHHAARLLEQPDSPLPVVLRLHESIQAFKLESLIRDFLDAQIEPPQSGFERFWQLFEAGQAVVMFDGLDAMAERVGGATLEANLAAIDRFARTGHVIVTCRPEFFAGGSTYGVAELEPMSDRDVAHHATMRVAGLPSSRESAEYYIDRIERLPGLSSLSTRPLHLEMLLRVLPQLIERGGKLDRPALFATYLREEFRRETVTNRRLRVMSDDDRLALLTDVVAAQLGVGIDQLDFERTARLIQHRLGVTDGELEPVTRDFLNRSFLARAGNTYRFAHKAIGEYLLSIELHRWLVQGDHAWLSAAHRVSALVAGLILDHLGGPSAYTSLLRTIGLDEIRAPLTAETAARMRFAVLAMGDHLVGQTHDMAYLAAGIVHNLEVALEEAHDLHQPLARVDKVMSAWHRYRDCTRMIERADLGAEIA